MELIDLHGQMSIETADLSYVEQIRRQRYLIRGHYARPGLADDGVTDCPLYYSSIEGLGGDETQTLAFLKSLPEKGAPKDYRMIDVANYAPLAITTDVGCLLNDFSWDRVQVVVDGETNQELSKILAGVLYDSEDYGSFSAANLFHTAASKGDAYVRVRENKNRRSKLLLEDVQPEYVYPSFKQFDFRFADAYRLVFQTIESSGGRDGRAPQDLNMPRRWVEYLDETGSEVFLDGVYDRSRSARNFARCYEPLLVHFSYRDSGIFFGEPSVDAGMIASVDVANIVWSHINNILMQSYANPILLLFGVPSTDRFEWGRRIVQGLPKDAKAEILHFEGMEDLLKIAQEKLKLVRDKFLQLVLHELRHSGSNVSGVSLAMRLFSYSAYLADVEHQMNRGFQGLGRLILKALKKWPSSGDVKIAVDWGARFPQDVFELIKEMESVFKNLGKTGPIVERYIRAMGYSAQDMLVIKTALERENEAGIKKKEIDASGGGVAGAFLASKSTKAADFGQKTGEKLPNY